LQARRASLALGVGRDLLIAIIAAAAGVLLSLSVQLQADEQELRQRSLRLAAEYIARHLEFDGDGGIRLPSVPGSSWAMFGYPALVLDRHGRLLYRRPDDIDPAVFGRLAEERLLPSERHGAEAVRYFRIVLGDERIIGAALNSGSGDAERTIVVFKDENAPDVLIDDIVRAFPYRSLEVLMPAFGLLLLAGIWIVRRRTRPVAEVAAIAETIGPYALDLRLPERGLPGEVLPIVRAINLALGRLEQGAGQQREFLRRAAHQLRTPLTVLSARAAGLGDSEVARQLLGDVEEIARLLTQLLELNEIDALPDSNKKVADLSAVAVVVHDAFVATAARRACSIVLTATEEAVLVHGDPNLIEVAARNLVENALEHSPTGGSIELRIRADATLSVADDGPGIAEEMRQTIFEPFQSGDANSPRAGLGLTIVQRIAKRCGATVSVDSKATAGATFTMQFRPVIEVPALDAAAIPNARPASLTRQHGRA